MEKPIRSGLRTTFLLQAISHAVFGIVFLLIPEAFATLVGLPVADWAMSIARMLGAAQLGFSAACWFAYKETLWERVKIVVQMEIVFNVMGTLAALYGLTLGGLPAMIWPNLIILVVFGVAFTVLYYRR
jgi:hypothetical protein